MYLHVLVPLAASTSINSTSTTGCDDWLRTPIIAAQRAGLLSSDLAQTTHDIRKAGSTAVQRGAVGERKAPDINDDAGKVLSALYGG